MAHAVSSTLGGTPVISLHGDIAEAEASDLRGVLIDAIWRDRAPRLVVEFARDVTMDATFVGALLAADAIASDSEAVIEFRCDDPGLRERLTALGLTATGSPPAQR